MTQDVKEVDIFNRYTHRNKQKVLLITLGIALFISICIFCLVKVLHTYTISYETNGGLVFGEELPDDTYDFLQKSVEPKDVRKTGYYLEGWYTDPNFEHKYNFNTAVWNNIKLYARWKEGYALILNFASQEESTYGMSLDEVKLYHEIYVKPGTTCSLPVVFNTVGRGEHCKNEIENHLGEQLLWFEDRACTGEAIFTKDYIMDKNINVYGRWYDTKEEKFNITETGILLDYLGYCKRIYLPESVYIIKEIKNEEFKTSISTQLGDQVGENFSAFRNVLKILEEVYVNSKMSWISECAFKACENLKYIHFPTDCKISEIKNNAFQGCINLQTIAIPNSVKTIGAYAFHGNESLQSVIVGEGVKTIKNNAFQNCRNLVEVKLPNVQLLEKNAFNSCSKLARFTLCSNTAVETNANLAENVLSTDQDIDVPGFELSFEFFVPSGLLDYYKNTEPWSAFAKFMKAI